MLEILISALIVAEIAIIGIAIYNTFKVSEFHKNEVGFNKFLKELLNEERETNKGLFEATQNLVKDQSYLTNEMIKLVKKEK